MNLQWNQWFLLISILVSIIFFMILSKKFPLAVIIIIWLYNVFLVQSVDFIIGIKPYNYYQFLNGEGWDLIYAITQYTLYPIMGYIFLHFYIKLNVSGFYLALYIGTSVILSAFYEWLSVVNEVLTYQNGWNLGTSVIDYILIFISEIFLLKFIKKYIPID